MTNNAVTTSNTRIAKNTLLLYLRMLFTMGITLYTSRVILKALGASDYGLYSVIGGFVAMFSVVSSSLTASISRFITFELGKGNNKNIQKIFSLSVYIQIIISLIIILLAETIGLWFLNNKMTIPNDRFFAANIVFQFSIITFVVNLISVPYNALIVAHERMKAFAYIGVFQAVLTLGIAYFVSLSGIDRLILYSILLAILSIWVRFLYSAYCKKNFVESKLVLVCDFKKAKEIFSFAGWNFIGSISGILRDQGVNILLNLFYGPIVNAARGIAVQVSGAVSSFSSNFMVALNPQITKNYAVGDFERTNALVFRGARFSFYLLLILSFPILFETNQILSIWLSDVPDYTVIFVRLVLIQVLIDSLSNTLITIMLATGKIRNYQLLVGSCILLNFPLSYILLKLGLQPQSTLFISISLCIVALYLRLVMLRKMILFPIKKFLMEVVARTFFVALLSFPVPFLITYFFNPSYVRLFTNIILSILITSIVAFFGGCSENERDFFIKKFYSLIKK